MKQLKKKKLNLYDFQNAVLLTLFCTVTRIKSLSHYYHFTLRSFH